MADSQPAGPTTGFLIVRLRALGGEPLHAPTLAALAEKRGLALLARTLRELGDPESAPLIRSVPPERLIEMERAAARGEYPPLRSLTQYWRLDLRERDSEDMELAVAKLRRLRDIETVVEEEFSIPAQVNPAADPLSPLQGYHDPAPFGIDAEWMWPTTLVDGSGIGVVDVEGGWQTSHEDLVGKVPSTPLHGLSNPNPLWRDHGTQVLGVIAAANSNVGVVGIAPGISSLRTSSLYFESTFSQQDVPSALAAAIVAMTVGDILLIELQTGSLYPQETRDDVLDLLRLATSQGILVVEAAGNGNHDLDLWSGVGSRRLLRGHPNFVDSGALMVGASVSTVPHHRAGFSNYGTRIDCYAWGQNVVTCGVGNLVGGSNPDAWYTNTFDGTSSASPIIVGAAALLQSHSLAVAQTVYSPTQLRDLLSDPATGTPQGTGLAGAIGVMPNLAAIVPSLGTVPDVYLRDAVGDTGLVPWTGGLCLSPDIIVRDTLVANPSFDFGVGTENMWALGDTAEAGQPNYVYVRVHNRGGAPASNVTATVYWSDPATLVAPSQWNLVGSTTIPSVPIGNVITVSPAITWSTVPAPGHYCFVAVLDHPVDPKPIDPANFPTMTAADYHDLIRNHNNVTWRNFNVVNNLPPQAGVVYPFAATGADAGPEMFGFEVERDLPRDTQLVLTGPTAFLRQIGKGVGAVEPDKEGGSRLVLPSRPRIRLGEARLGGRIRYRCAIRIIPGREKIDWGHGAAIRQLFDGKEIGRVAWRFAPRSQLCPRKTRSGASSDGVTRDDGRGRAPDARATRSS